jgi:polyhydroxyalkanoate synthase
MADRGDSKANHTNAADGSSAAEAYIVKDPEAFARNVARMLEELGKAASAWVEPREKGEVVDTVSEPMADMVKTFSKVGEYWLSDPKRAHRSTDVAAHQLFRTVEPIDASACRHRRGQPQASKPATSAFPIRIGRTTRSSNFSRMPISSPRTGPTSWSESDGLDEHTRQKAQFYMRQITSALSPANFLVTNPELYKEMVASNGENLVRGMQMLAEDIAAGKGELKLRQSDASKFKLSARTSRFRLAR